VAYVIGTVLACCVSLFARLAGFDRDRAFYPTMLVVIASFYILFAVMGGSVYALAVESMIMIGFLVVAVLGLRLNLWIVVAGLAGHGLFDALHPSLLSNPGVPAWWPPFCLAYDVTAASCLAWVSTHPDPNGARSSG
jgi:hypothetical protein